MKKLIGVVVILLTLLLTVIYRQLTASRVKEKPGHAYMPARKAERDCASLRLREELPLLQLLIQ